MKVKNKKTGEIADIEINSHHLTIVYEDGRVEQFFFDSLKDLADWEDYEEPETFWYMTAWGDVKEYSQDQFAIKQKIAIGNYFDSREEAEKAVEKLKAWKRLKDKGFSFDPVGRYEALCGNGFNIPITATMPPEAYTDTEVSKDLDICFGGE